MFSIHQSLIGRKNLDYEKHKEIPQHESGELSFK